MNWLFSGFLTNTDEAESIQLVLSFSWRSFLLSRHYLYWRALHSMKANHQRWRSTLKLTLTSQALVAETTRTSFLTVHLVSSGATVSVMRKHTESRSGKNWHGLVQVSCRSAACGTPHRHSRLIEIPIWSSRQQVWLQCHALRTRSQIEFVAFKKICVIWWFPEHQLLSA